MTQFSHRKSVLQDLEQYARQALDSEFGVRVLTNNPERIRSEFYTLRKELRKLGDDSFNKLTIRQPQSETEALWIIPKAVLED